MTNLINIFAITGFIVTNQPTNSIYPRLKFETQLPATVSTEIVVDVKNGDNHKGCNLCNRDKSEGVFSLMHPSALDCMAFDPPTQRWTITNTIERTTVTVDWRGKKIVHTEDELIKSETNRWKMEWRKE
jgi:hypothetical protein